MLTQRMTHQLLTYASKLERGADAQDARDRVHRTMRPHVAAVGRRVLTLCQGETGRRQQLTLSHRSDNVCLLHTS